MLRQFLLYTFITAITCFGMMPKSANASNSFHGVAALSYIHVNAPDHPDSSLSQGDYDDHINEIIESDLEVITASKLVQLFKTPDLNAPGQILITFEAAHRDLKENAIPQLERNRLPYLMFFSTDGLGEGLNVLTKGELKKLAAYDLAEFGIHGCRYELFVGQTTNDLKTCLNRSVATFKDIFGERPKYFAVPYGVYNEEVMNVLNEYGFELIFGSHSGVINVHDSSEAANLLPRFPLSDPYGGIDRFTRIARAGALPIENVLPISSFLSGEQNPPSIGFSIDPKAVDIDKVNCFLSGYGALKHEKLGDSRIEITLNAPLTEGRHRLNCTVRTESDDWTIEPELRWYGRLFFVE